MLLVFVPKLGWAKGLWFAVFHRVSAWNNAGFALFSNNLEGYRGSLLVNAVITGLIIFGGIGYEVILELYVMIQERLRRQKMKTARTLNFRVAVSTTLFLLFGGTLAIWAIETRNPQTLGSLNLSEQLLAAWFQSVTARTAGFNTIDESKLTIAGMFVTVALMFIGASPGGTAGGIKTSTARVLASCTYAILQGKESVILYRRQVPNSLLLKAIAAIFGSMMTVICGTIAISLADPQLNFINILFEVVSAFATVGLVNEGRVADILSAGISAHAVVLDSTNPLALKEAGIFEFDTVIVAIGNYLQKSIITTLNLKEAGVSYVIAKASSDVHAKLLQKVGADRLVLPEYEGGCNLAQTLIKPEILDRLDLDPKHSIVELKVPESFYGKTILELRLRSDYGLNVLAIGQSQHFDINPKPDRRLGEEDVLVVIGTKSDLDRLPL